MAGDFTATLAAQQQERDAKVKKERETSQGRKDVKESTSRRTSPVKVSPSIWVRHASVLRV
jgi:hypothetical protein